MKYESYWDMLIGEMLKESDSGVLLLTSSNDFDLAVSVQVLNSKDVVKIEEDGVSVTGVAVKLFKTDKKIKDKFLRKLYDAECVQLGYISMNTIEKYKQDFKEELKSLVDEYVNNELALCVLATNKYVDEGDLSRIYQAWEEDDRPDGLVMYDEILYLIAEFTELQNEESLDAFVQKRFENIEFFKRLIVIQQSEDY